MQAAVVSLISLHTLTKPSCCLIHRPVRPIPHSGPSGIAQLRKSSENVMGNADPMNIDDFIFSDKAATPAGIASPQTMPQKATTADNSAAGSRAGAIPIKSRKDSFSPFVPQSVPVAQHPHRNQNEFNYINRHHRKTSIDEQRAVSFCTLVCSRNQPSPAQSAFPSSPPLPTTDKPAGLPVCPVSSHR